MKRVLACTIFALALAGLAQGGQRPNILFIAIDDQNDWIGYIGGHPQAHTPNIDRLASQGTAFTNAHCQSPLCNSSRTSLMLSRRPDSTGIYGLAPWFRNVPELQDAVPLPRYLKKHGYTTYSAGKIYHGGYGRKPKDNEFDHLGPGATGAPFPKKKLVNTPSNHPLVDWGVFPHKDEDKGDYKIATWAVEQLDAKPEGPFFLSAGFFLPHVPCFATQKWFDLFPEETLQLPKIKRGDRDDTPRFSWYLHWKLPEPRLKFLEEANEWKNLTRSYLACTAFVDHQVGRLLDALERNGYADNTIVVLWSDHGWHIGEKGITGKNTLWDDGTRVPLVFAGPGIAKGRCSQPAELLDIYPTLNALCGLPEKTDLDGISLLPQLKDAATPRVRPAITTHNHDNHGVRSEHWRYIRYADGSEELYDMRKDPNEWTNLIGNPEYDKVIAEHRKWIPKVSRKPAPGSRSRILTHDPEGKTIWEGKEIGKDDPIPEL
jgi:arylsulfatase A-like enzyme